MLYRIAFIPRAMFYVTLMHHPIYAINLKPINVFFYKKLPKKMNVDDLYHCQNAQKLLKFLTKIKMIFKNEKFEIYSKYSTRFYQIGSYTMIYFIPLMIIFICDPY
jgi:hypothetical protein